MEETVLTGDLAAPPAADASSPPSPSAIPQAVEAEPTHPQRPVPYGALAEERARRKDLQRELQSTREEQQRLQGRLDLLHELAQQQDDAPAGNPAQLPTGDETDVPRMAPDLVEQQAVGAFRTQVMQSVREFATARPDFPAAYEHARQARVSELMTLGYAPEEAVGITFDNEMEIIQHAYATGRNPAEVIYRYATQRGFGGVAPAGRASAGGILSEAQKVALAARGQAAAKSLSAVGGGATGNLTLEALAGMSDDEFAEATKGDRWQRLLRG